jgi:hypothetical protein
MMVVRYKQPETADAARPADPDTLAGAAFFTKPTWDRVLVLALFWLLDGAP